MREYPSRPLVLENVTLGYDRRAVVQGLSGEIAPGSLLGVAGPNGAGKSTLLKALAGRLRPLSGRIDHPFGTQAYLPQMTELNREFPISTLDFVLTGLARSRGGFAMPDARDRRRAEAALDDVGLVGGAQFPCASSRAGNSSVRALRGFALRMRR